MQVDRKIALSIYDELKEQFTAGSILGGPVTVYGEDELRAGSVPAFPYVYLLQFGTTFGLNQLPCVIIENIVDRQVLELGNPAACYCHLYLHVFGHNRTERADICSGIKDSFLSVRLRDYSGSSAVTETQQLEPDESGRIWRQSDQKVPATLQREGSLAEWSTLAARLWALDTTL